MKNDLISRAALISAFLNRQRSEHEVKYHTIPGEDVLDMIQTAPAVEPTKGEWIVDGALIACNKCGRIFLKASELYNFCPECGADMGGGAES